MNSKNNQGDINQVDNPAIIVNAADDNSAGTGIGKHLCIKLTMFRKVK